MKLWNTKPMVVAVGVPVSNTLVLLGGYAVDDEVVRVVVSRPPTMFSSVVLPDPEAEQVATNSLSRNEMGHVVERHSG